MKKIRQLLQETTKDIYHLEDDFELAYKEYREASSEPFPDVFAAQNALADLIHAARLLGYISGGGDIMWFAALGEMRAFSSTVTAAEDSWRKAAAIWARS